ncbi:hypothetical protein CWE08_03440 [Aliidiomarina iranensis]|uniref:DUF4810 domain-containing protein n=1 Tax=Aliidiomarina iranensis TaxID=1434071 RepID=A0A432VZR6_9GAMM|nr:DUF4810 domain-containing protein [Aliidiomarina iranensis]RUO22254.1 hypothetical protein CWE08_03440 [Aliidiomarina iranensis]
MSQLRLILLALSSLTLVACASNQGLYNWANYEETLFVNYHEPAVKEQMLDGYLNYITAYDTQGKRLGPGLYAEAGTFMLERGDSESAIKFYELERDNWPESELLMNTLIKNLQERAQ